MRAQNSDRSISLLLDYPRAAEALGLTEQALRDLVWKNRGPVVTEIGRRRMFALATSKNSSRAIAGLQLLPTHLMKLFRVVGGRSRCATIKRPQRQSRRAEKSLMKTRDEPDRRRVPPVKLRSRSPKIRISNMRSKSKPIGQQMNLFGWIYETPRTPAARPDYSDTQHGVGATERRPNVMARARRNK